jgi:PilZ domain
MMNTEQVVIGLKRGDFGAIATDRRVDERRPCEPTPVRIFAEGDPSGIEALVVNVSKSGIGMRLDRRVTSGAKVRVEMKAIIITGSIRYCTSSRDAGWFDVGLQIDTVLGLYTA